MKIGIIVDGVSEFASLPELYPGLSSAGSHQLLKPVRADIQPKAPLPVIVKRCRPKIDQFLARGADRVVVLLDREDRDECAGDLASSLVSMLSTAGVSNVDVVVKDRMFENWLLGDLDALRASPNRFQVSRSTERAVQPDKADRVEAMALLKRCAKGPVYDKVRDSKIVLRSAQPDQIAMHSRSFRRFMRVVGCSRYTEQSRRPA
jgi:hypothetical protein